MGNAVTRLYTTLHNHINSSAPHQQALVCWPWHDSKGCVPAASNACRGRAGGRIERHSGLLVSSIASGSQLHV